MAAPNILPLSILQNTISRIYGSIKHQIGEPWFVVGMPFFGPTYNEGYDGYKTGISAYPKHIEYLAADANVPISGGTVYVLISPLDILALQSADEFADFIHTKIGSIMERALDYMEDWYTQQLELNLLQGVDHGWES
jgi:hypothetical protein